MQRSLLNRRDRAGAIAGVVLVHAGILLALLNASERISLDQPQEPRPIETFDVVELPPPPPIVEEVPQERSPREEGAAAPPNIESKATPVVAPPPVVRLPNPPPVVASETPAQGTQPTQGAAPVPGPGTGAGGVGTGTGSGGSGSGPGGGGVSGRATRPSVIPSTTLTGRDYPPAVLRAWPRGTRIFVAVRVQVDGRATNCRVDRSSGNRVVDEWTCRLVEERVRFRPAVDDNGRPYVSWYGYVQVPIGF